MRERATDGGRGTREKQGVAGSGGSSSPQPSTLSPAPTTVLGFDYGTRRIGIAVGNSISRSSRALEVLANAECGPDWSRLDALLREWRPDALLVGLPLTVNDAEQQASRAARSFAAEMEARYRLPVTLVDERHSSREAAQRFAERRAGGAARRKHAAALDAEAAAIIVERWLDHG
ncbi:MAG TPA: Holliday junction resolvase RuvX [Rudaea sp.]|nr:Holliday junction resolvase RuvX [Rudaea sp.]